MQGSKVHPRALAPVVLLAALAGLLPAVPGFAACQTLSGLTYATYTDAAGQEQALRLELLLPSGAASPTPLVIWIHGGGWQSGSRLPIPAGVSALCSRGYAVASLDYRLVPEAIWPAQLHDCRGAVRWLRAHAVQYNLDPDRFGVWGSSAGGHLASMLGTAGGAPGVTIGNVTVDLEGATGGNLDRSSRVQAVVDWYGQTDFLQMRFYPTTINHDADKSHESRLIGGRIQQNPERTATASPIFHATPDDPPFLVMHGTVDTTVPFNQSELLVDALRAQGVPVTFVPVEGANHGDGPLSTQPNLQIVYGFLDAALKNLGGTTLSVEAVDAEAAEAGADAAVFRISRTGSATEPLPVRWALAGTAKLGADYAAPVGPAVIPAGAVSIDLAVRPQGDRLVEGSETVELALASDPAWRIDASRAAATIEIADGSSGAGLPVVRLEASDPAASETGPDGGAFLFTVEGGSGAGLTVRYAVAGTASNGADYGALSGSLTLAAGQTSALLDVDLLDDPLLEPAESVVVTLEPSQDYVVGAPSSASVVIADSDRDTAKPIVSVSATDPAASEPGSPGAFAVTRTGSTASPLTVRLVPSGGAEGGTDYAALPASATFGANVSRVFVAVRPIDDAEAEGPESVGLAVAPDPAISRGPYDGSRVVIEDDEPSRTEGFYPLSPCRLVDTRGPASPHGAPSLSAGEVRLFPVSGSCGVPVDAAALSLNLTVVGAAADGFLTLLEPGAPVPLASAINFRAGHARANNAILRLAGTPRHLAVSCSLPAGTVDVIIDVNGYFRE